MKQFLIAIDQTLNTLFGSGWADETLSAYFWRTKRQGWIKFLNLFETDHCQKSYESEQARMQLPPEYRV